MLRSRPRRSHPGIRSSIGRCVIVVSLLLVTLSGGQPRPANAAHAAVAQSAHATAEQIRGHLEVVLTAYDQILDTYVRPQEPGTLLQPALESVLSDAAKAVRPRVPPEFAHPRLSSNRDDAFTTFSGAYTVYAGSVSDAEAQQAAFRAIDAMCRSLNDDHTGFLSPDDVASFASLLGDAPGFGIGVTLGQRPALYIQELAPNGPAEQAGLRPGDVIVAVDGTRVAADGGGLRVLKDGSRPHSVQVDRPGARTLDIAITPGPYTFPMWTATVLPGGIGLMRLRAFGDPWVRLADGRTIDQVIDDSLVTFEAAGVQDWVLDLRNNPGGSGLLADALTGRFVADSLTDRQFDSRGHTAQDLTDGHLFRVQRPLAVLINRGSTSSSEIASSTFRESGRAILVGQQTGGALANAVLWPLGEGAGIELTFADVHTGIDDAVIDRAGVPVDVAVADRTAADYAAGRDPQLDAAVAALRQQDQAPRAAPANDLVPLGRAGVEALVRSFVPGAAALKPTPGMQAIRDLGGYTLTSYNEYNGWTPATISTSGSGGGRDAVQTRDAARERGWLGGHIELYGGNPLGPALWAEWEAYAGEAGAAAALAANDFPDLWMPLATTVHLGDDGKTVAFRGDWGDRGTTILRWRHGSIVFTAEYQASPDAESAAAASAFAGEIDSAYVAAAARSLLNELLIGPLARLAVRR
jgi:carboxyl-terminal processing protease